MIQQEDTSSNALLELPQTWSSFTFRAGCILVIRFLSVKQADSRPHRAKRRDDDLSAFVRRGRRPLSTTVRSALAIIVLWFQSKRDGYSFRLALGTILWEKGALANLSDCGSRDSAAARLRCTTIAVVPQDNESNVCFKHWSKTWCIHGSCWQTSH